MKDRFPPDDCIPLFLSGPAERPEQSGIRKVVSSEVLRKAVLVFAAAAVVFAVVSAGKAIFFASVTASEVSAPAPRDVSGDITPAIQSTASAEALPRSPPGDELLAAFKSALENKAEVDQPRAEALLHQFQAWAVEKDTQTPVQPLKSVPDPRENIVQKPPLPRPRPINVEQTVRAQDPSTQNAPSLLQRFGWRN